MLLGVKRMIELTNINKSFTDKVIFQNASLSLPNKGMVLLLGPNGCGKSTLLQIIGGLDEDFQGQLSYSSRKMTEKEKINFSDNSIVYLNQSSILFEEYSVIQNILLPYQSKNKEKAISLLNSLGIENLANEEIKSLSEGEKARVCLVRALLKDPTIVLADEITAGLDIESSNKIDDLLKEYSKKAIVLLATHKKEDIQFFSNCKTITIKDKNIITNFDINKSNDESEDTIYKNKDERLVNKTFSKTLASIFVPFLSLFFALISSFSLLFTTYSKCASDSSFNLDYLFNNYPYLINDSSLGTGFLPDSNDRFYLDFDNHNLVSGNDKSDTILSTVYLNKDDDLSLFPPPVIGRTPATNSEIMIPKSRYQRLLSVYDISDNEFSLSTLSICWNYHIYSTEKQYQIIGVYDDIESSNTTAKTYLSSIISNETKKKEYLNNYFTDPLKTFSILDYGCSTAFSYSDNSTEQMAFLSTEKEKEKAKAFMQSSNLKIQDIFSQNPYLVNDNETYPYLSLIESGTKYTKTSYLLLVLSFIASLAFTITFYSVLKGKVVLYRAINGNRKSLSRYFKKYILFGAGFQLIAFALLSSIFCIFLNQKFNSILLFTNKISFLNTAWYLYLIVIISFAVEVLLLLLANKHLFKTSIQKQIKELS